MSTDLKFSTSPQFCGDAVDTLRDRAGDDECTLKPPHYVDPTPRPLPLWGKRADRAYRSTRSRPSLSPLSFAALVIVVHPRARPMR